MTEVRVNNYSEDNAMKIVIDNDKESFADWLLLQNGRNSNKCNNFFLEAAVRGHKEICELLIKYSNNSSDFDVSVAFLYACLYGKLSIVKLLSLSRVNMLCGLTIASCCGHKNVVVWLLKSYIDISSTEMIRWMLIAACGSGDLAAIARIMTNPEADIQDMSVMSHALQAACYGGHTHIVNWLLEHSSADICHINMAMPGFLHETSPLSMAAAKGRRKIVTNLLTKKPCGDINMLTGKYKDTVLHYVIWCDSHGSNTLNDHVGSPLHQACYDGDLERVHSLLYSCNVNEQQNDGLTPLHWACEQGYEEICKWLLSSGADTLITSDRKKTPIEYAKENNNTEIVSLINYYEATEIIYC